MEYTYDFETKDEMLKKLQNYAINPDDDNIRVKDRIKGILLHAPELLYALNCTELESELFNEDGTLNTEGEWDRYFGENGLIRPYLYIPETQADVKHYICYQTSTDELYNYNRVEKTFLITFVVLINGKDPIDKLTGIARHDLIASIIREKIAWGGLTSSSAVPISDKEGSTDNNYLMRTIKYQAGIPNNLSKTDNGNSYFINKWK